MSLYHETAEIVSMPPSAGGSLKSRIFGRKGLKSPPGQVYALALETCKWSPVLKEVVENSELLKEERKLTPVLALLLVHDFLLSRNGVSLPQSHGLRAAVERHKTRLGAEFTRARLRRKMPSVDALRAEIEAGFQGHYPRWVRVNTLRTELEVQLKTTFAGFERVYSVKDLTEPSTGGNSRRAIYIDEHVPNLVAVSPGTDLTRTEAYAKGAVILQDKASCFPAYLLDPHAEDGDVIDACAAPGNKTTHLAAIAHAHRAELGPAAARQLVLAFERDEKRALTLEIMVKKAGAKPLTRIALGQDFLKADPAAETWSNVGALLLDPSCSGSGIVGRDAMPELQLPGERDRPSSSGGKAAAAKKPEVGGSMRKRKRGERDEEADKTLIDDDGNATVLASGQELEARLKALSTFQRSIVVHAFRFPAATKVTYSTCSEHAEENEHVVLAALQSDVAKERGWRLLRRDEQVRGMRDWPVRGSAEACSGDGETAESCIRSYKDDGRGVMGFFVAAFVREGAKPPGSTAATEACHGEGGDDGPYVRDEEGRIIRDIMGMPTLKSTGLPVPVPDMMSFQIDGGDEESTDESDGSEDEDSEEDEDGSPEGDSAEDKAEDSADDDGSESEARGGEGDEWNGIED